MQTKTASKVIN